jgi:two-component system chemotaxis response regulator CheY
MPAPASIRVLVVDDQMTMRSLVRTGLQQLGLVDVNEAPDGEEALRSLLTRPVHLVISDYNMPKLDGLGLLRAIRSHPPLAKTAFIMLTGRADKELVQKAVQFGVNNYLVKPFTVTTLKEKIEAVFGKLS